MAATHPSNELTSQLLTNNIFKDQQRRRRLTVSKRQKMRQSTCRKTNRLLPCSERQKGPGGVPDIQSSRGRHQRLLAIIIVSGYLQSQELLVQWKSSSFSPMAGRPSKPSCVFLLGQKKLRSDSQRISTANFAADRLGIPMKLAQWLGLSLILARGIFLASRPCLFLAIPCCPLLA
ncbi:hypothetical protein H105_00488, partial [Trichophyton soudanense CBS 452.61]